MVQTRSLELRRKGCVTIIIIKNIADGNRLCFHHTTFLLDQPQNEYKDTRLTIYERHRHKKTRSSDAQGQFPGKTSDLLTRIWRTQNVGTRRQFGGGSQCLRSPERDPVGYQSFKENGSGSTSEIQCWPGLKGKLKMQSDRFLFPRTNGTEWVSE